MTTFAMIETAKRIMSSDTVYIQADNVVTSKRMGGDHGEQLEAIKFIGGGKVLLGLWTPECDWEYVSDIPEGTSGTFTRTR